MATINGDVGFCRLVVGTSDFASGNSTAECQDVRESSGGRAIAKAGAIAGASLEGA